MATIKERAWTKKPLTSLLAVFKQDLEMLDPASCLNIDVKDWAYQVFIHSREVKKVGHDRFHPYCRHKPEYLSAEQVLARIQEWIAKKFDWESELVDFKQIRIVKLNAGYLWCSHRMEHYPAPYLHRQLNECARRLGTLSKEYTK
jgi:hypothetical protein